MHADRSGDIDGHRRRRGAAQSGHTMILRLRSGQALRTHQRGVALVAVLIALSLFGALAFSLVMVTNTEMRAASNHAAGREAFHAADGAVEIAAQELLEVADWNTVLGGASVSRFADGPPAGSRQLADGRTISLPDLTAAADSEARPWGANNPRWRLFAFGPLGP